MKILMLQAAYYPWIGGAEVFNQRIAEHMVSLGNEVDIVTCKWKAPDVYIDSWNKKEDLINGVRIYREKPLNVRYIKTFSAIYPMYKKCILLHSLNKYDFIHAHIFPGMVTGAMLKNKLKIPLITTVQGGDLADYKETTGPFGFILKPLISWALKQADIIHAVSSYTAKRAEELGAKKTVIIPNGVDIKLFKPNDKKQLRIKYKYGINDKIIISNSRLTPKNGLDVLIEAVKILVQRMPNIKLLLIGDGEQRSQLQGLTFELGLERHIFFLGYIKNEELPDYLNLSDVFCRPSYNEGFGISFIEAMACGLPVIGTNVGGIPDIIENNKNGLLVVPGDEIELSRNIIILLNNDFLRNILSENAQKKIEMKFSWNIVLKNVIRMYRDLER